MENPRNFPMHADAGESTWIVGAWLKALISFFAPRSAVWLSIFIAQKVDGTHRAVVV
jgi:hypothetical protein